MNNRHLYWLAGTLTLIGLAIFAYKLWVLGFPLAADHQADVWNIEARISFDAQGGSVRADFRGPSSTAETTVLHESFVTGDFGRTQRRVDANRVARLSSAGAQGPQVLYYRAAVQVVAAKQDSSGPGASPTVSGRSALAAAEQAAAAALLKRLRRQSANTETLVALLIQALRESHPGDEAQLLLTTEARAGAGTGAGALANTAVRILNYGGIPARRVSGLQLIEERRRARLVRWLEVYTRSGWQPFSALDGAPRAPDRAFAWWRGPGPALGVTGAVAPRVTFATQRAPQSALDAAVTRGRNQGASLVDFSLFGLPLQVQAVFRILLVVPLGVLVLVVLRNLVGLRTFGTFMPVLIAISFRETNLLWGVVLFVTILFVGTSVRFYFDRLKLLLVPRLAAVVIVVILLMALFSVITFKLGIERGLSIALFPIVILTMTIERMTVVWEERGPRAAVLQALGSLVAAVAAFALMTPPQVEHVAFVFPELLLVVLAVTLLLGRYSGYRLTELERFKALIGKDEGA